MTPPDGIMGRRAALRCRTLDAVAPHLFSSRQPQLSPDVCDVLARAVGAPGLVTAPRYTER